MTAYRLNVTYISKDSLRRSLHINVARLPRKWLKGCQPHHDSRQRPEIFKDIRHDRHLIVNHRFLGWNFFGNISKQNEDEQIIKSLWNKTLAMLSSATSSSSPSTLLQPLRGLVNRQGTVFPVNVLIILPSLMLKQPLSGVLIVHT